MDSRWHIRLFDADTVRIGAPYNPWNHPAQRQPFWRLYCNDGDGPYLILPPEGQVYPLCAGVVYLIPAGVDFQSRAPRDVGHFYVHFDVVGVPRVAMRELFGRPTALADVPRINEMVRSLWGVRQRDVTVATTAEQLAQDFRVTALLYEAMAVAIGRIPAAAQERFWYLSAAQESVRPALEHIDTQLAEPLPVADLAALCCLSKDYFIRRFRECVGVTPTQYILEQRVAAAAQRLLFTSDTIERIIGETGFGSRHYFTRVFKAHTGRSPAAYRNVPPI